MSIVQQSWYVTAASGLVFMALARLANAWSAEAPAAGGDGAEVADAEGEWLPAQEVFPRREQETEDRAPFVLWQRARREGAQRAEQPTRLAHKRWIHCPSLSRERHGTGPASRVPDV